MDWSCLTPKARETARPISLRVSNGYDYGEIAVLLEAERDQLTRLKPPGANPDRRDVPDSVKHAVEVEYGLAPRSYGRTLELDHIVSLELGGSNDIANLFPEKANANPGYKVKDKLENKLENKLHDLVCDGTLTLRATQRRIARDWQALYKSVYGVAPSG